MTGSQPQYKVSRVVEEFGLTGIEEELVARRTSEENPLSLRDLAAFFNRRVLRAAMEKARMDPLEGEVENTYRLLTEDDVSSGVRTETEKKLQRNGIDVDRLTSSFVTYQAIRSYLKEERKIDTDRPSDEDPIDRVAQSVERLRNRTTTVTEEKLGQLRRSGNLPVGEFRVLLDLRVFCEDCGSQYEFEELLENDGCNCAGSNSKRE